MDEQQRLIVSAWLPLGVNNLLPLAEHIKYYLDTKQQELQLISWDGQVQVQDTSLTFTVQFNAPYSKDGPDSYTVEARYFGWGYIAFSLVSDKESSKDTTLEPIVAGRAMSFLLGKVRGIMAGTLLSHQHNYMANVLVSSGAGGGDASGGGILRAEEYVRAAMLDDLKNGIMDGASREDIVQAFRFEPVTSYEEGLTPNRRDTDLLVKTLVLRCSGGLDPRAYDPNDRDFGECSRCRDGEFYLRGRHRSSLLAWARRAPGDQLVDLICSANALIRFVRYLLQTMLSARQQLSLVRIALLEHWLRVRFEQEVPEGIRVPGPDTAEDEEITRHLKYLQSYVLYLVSRVPLLDEVVEYAVEAQEKTEAWWSKVVPLEGVTEARFDPKVREYEDDLFKELLPLREYVSDLLKTATRVQDGLRREIESVTALVRIYDEEESLALLGVLPEIESIQDETRRLAERQEVMQKRVLEAQFVQSELARAREARERTRGALTQASGAVALGGLLSAGLKGFIAALVSVASPGVDLGAIEDAVELNILVPLAGMVIGWFAAGGLVSRARVYRDMFEVVFPFELERLGDKGAVLLFDEADLLSFEAERQFHRVRVEGDIYRVTWEDEVELTVTKRQFLWTRSHRRSRGALSTLEYRRQGSDCLLESMTVSMERSNEYGKGIKELRGEIIETASKQLCEITKRYTEAIWAGFLERAIGVQPSPETE